MRIVRAAVATMEPPGLTIPQFRTLLFLQGHSDASLSATAEFLGLTLPSTSKLVDQLVRRSLVERGDAKDDRRRMQLRLTEPGDALLKSAQGLVRDRLAGMLDRFRPAEVTALQKALEMLQGGLALLAGETPVNGNARSGNVK
jgi:DNA-binding MarR family transcriptional regulator